MSFDCQATLVSDETEGKAALRIVCNCWGKECCQPRRRKRLIREIRDGEPNRFITLTTSHGQPEKAEAEAKRMGDWLRALMRRVQHQTKQKALAYFVVREAHQDGWPHLHVAWRGPWLSQNKLSAWWQEISGSPIVDIRVLDNPGRAAAYLSKYLGKSPHKFGTAKRYWQTQAYRKAPKFEPQPLPNTGGPYHVDTRTLSQVHHDWLCRGYRPTEPRPGLLVWWSSG